MTKTEKCISIARMLNNRGPMTRKEICRELLKRWPEDGMLSRSTFMRYKEQVEELFLCEVRFNFVDKTYSIDWQGLNDDTNLIHYLFAMYDIRSSASMMMKHKDCIHHVDYVTGTDSLHLILRAIDERRGIEAAYTSFRQNTLKRRIYIPIFLTIWEGRWYCIAEVTTHLGQRPCVYALERMADIRITDEHYTPSYTGTHDDYFRDTYGIQGGNEGDQAETIVIRANKVQSDYLRAKPMHVSQREMDTCEEGGELFTYFRYRLVPCYNFYQQLMWLRESIEVVSPQSVRDELAEMARKVLEKYMEIDVKGKREKLLRNNK